MAGILKACPAGNFTGTSRVWYPDVVFVTNLMVQLPGCRQIKAKYSLSGTVNGSCNFLGNGLLFSLRKLSANSSSYDGIANFAGTRG